MLRPKIIATNCNLVCYDIVTGQNKSSFQKKFTKLMQKVTFFGVDLILFYFISIFIYESTLKTEREDAMTNRFVSINLADRTLKGLYECDKPPTNPTGTIGVA